MIFFTGFLVGIVSLIPGISGGTILVLTHRYEEITNAITHFRERKNLTILFFFILGIFLGTITFARIIELLFYFIPTTTLIFFSGLILFNLPSFIQAEKIKIRPFWFSLGVFFLFFLSLFHTHSAIVVVDYPEITVWFLFYFLCCGAIDGFFTILPGISGSMIMMILGPYFLYKSFLANLSLQNILFFFPLFFYFIGDAIGFFIGSKVSLYLLQKYRIIFLSLVVGMILMSALLILPALNFSLTNSIVYFIPLFISFLLCQFLNSLH